MDAALSESTAEALRTPWIVDVDTSIKPLYGHQARAQVSYNPRKRSRPSHVLHTYWMGNLRLVLDVEVQAGRTHAAKHSMPRLRTLLQGLSRGERPALVRGDNAFGNEAVMLEVEGCAQLYLFKLRQGAGVKGLVERQWSRADWRAVGQGFEAVEAELKLMGWDAARRVVVLRRGIEDSLMTKLADAASSPQQVLHFAEPREGFKLFEYAVLVTNTRYSLAAIAQLYRDRADCENGFDELKNQWGWSGYTTYDLERCDLSGRAVALVYNWWSWYVRLENPKARREAITSRPLLRCASDRARRSIPAIAHLSARRRRTDQGDDRCGSQGS